MGSSFWNAVRSFFWGLRHCKSYEVESDEGVTLDRRSHLALCVQEMRTSMFPYRLMAFSTTEPTTMQTWHWRGRLIRTTEVTNPFFDDRAANRRTT